MGREDDAEGALQTYCVTRKHKEGIGAAGGRWSSTFPLLSSGESTAVGTIKDTEAE